MSARLKNMLNRLSSSAVIIVCIVTGYLVPAAAADSVFLVQLGAYPSKSEANSTWDSLQSKNTDVLGNLTLRVSEVSLPPDNKTTYRVQAGPISSHDQASSICTTLQARKLTCYVVETALFTSDSAPKIAVAAPAEPDTSVKEPVFVAPEQAVSETKPTGKIVSPFVAPKSGKTAEQAVEEPVKESVKETEEVKDSPATKIAALPFKAPAVVKADSETTTDASASETVMASADAASTTPRITKLPFVNPALIKNSEPTTTISEPTTIMASNDIASAPESIPAPVPTPRKERGFFSRLFGSSDEPSKAESDAAKNPVTASGASASGKVDVAEAIRVPLGSGRIDRSAAAKPLPAVHSLGGYPSQQSSEKTFWAQLSYFTDEADANSFFEEFRDVYPQLAEGVRVRITRPYAAGNAGRVSLRVGPFATNQDVNTICTAARAKNMRCLPVRDIGSSVAANSSRLRSSYSTYVSKAQGDENDPDSLFWGLLGTYKTPNEAWKQWNALKSTNKATLGKVHVSVSLPPASSATKPLFRLRVGPFVVKSNAASLCEKLQSDGTHCLVVQGR